MDWIPVHDRVTPNIKFSVTHLYTSVESGATLFPGSLIFVPRGERGETLAQAGHMSLRIWEMTIKLLEGGAA